MWFILLMLWLATTSIAAYLFGRYTGNPRGTIYIAWYLSFIWPIALLTAWVLFLYRVGYSEGET